MQCTHLSYISNYKVNIFDFLFNTVIKSIILITFTIMIIIIKSLLPVYHLYRQHIYVIAYYKRSLNTQSATKYNILHNMYNTSG